MGLQEYWRKRDFSITPEPSGKSKAAEPEGRSYLIQKHAASHLHYDFRLELEGVLKSWSVPKGPSLDPTVRRLAMHTEDHPIDYGDFEGIIPKGQYGGGTVLLWDRGTWEPIEDPHRGYHAGKLKFRLHGEKLSGVWALVKTRGRDDDDRSWLLIKDKDEAARPMDEFSIVDERQESVATGRSMDEIAAAKDRVWHSNREEGSKKKGNGHAGGEARPAAAAAKARKAAAAAAAAAAEARKVDPVAIASRVPGARKGRMPANPRPEVASPASEPPAGDGWVHEIRIDGLRAFAIVQSGDVRLVDEKGEDRTEELPGVAEAIRGLGLTKAVLDGVVTAFLPGGATSAEALQGALGSAKKKGKAKSNGGGAGAEVVYLAFDILHLEGHNLTGAPLSARKAALEELLGRSRGGPVRPWGHIVGSGEEVFQKGCRLSLKGIISKRRDAPYKPGASEAWLSLDCHQKAEPEPAKKAARASGRAPAKKGAPARARTSTAKKPRR
jgi:bifunctional non-homologous end joining protein LigD